MRTVATAGLLVAMAVPGAARGVDLTGRWFVESGGGSQIVTVTQSGSDLAIAWGVPLTGTVGVIDANGVTSYAVGWTSEFGQVAIAGRILPSGNLFDGRVVSAPPFPPQVAGLVATRCTCFDGNGTTGDGCDATCQVEPCWTCTGDPSSCAPAPEGGACEDGNACTSGDTCTAGLCTAGTPFTPCVDLNGPWTRHSDIPALAQSSDTPTTIRQRGTDLRLDAYTGYIDPATGAFDLRAVNPHLFCPAFDTLAGSAAADGLTYSASGSLALPQPATPDHCDTFIQLELGDHCGDGTHNGTESCDDGNLHTGDGCTARCAIEPCWTCAGTPSVCAPANGTACDDGDACTSGDACDGSGTCSGAPLACAPCLACDSAQGCVAAPRAACTNTTAPDKSLLLIRHAADPAKHKVLWRWNKGADIVPGELAEVPAGITLCVYDASTSVPALLFRAHAPDTPPWTARGGGFAYKDPAAGGDGILTALIKPGTGGTARAKVIGKGAALASRPDGLPAPPLPLPLRVQLQGSDELCLETRHDAAGVLKNDPARGVFKARAVP